MKAQIMKAQIVSFHCTLKDKLGRQISSTFNQDVITQDPTSPQHLAGLAKKLQNLKKGERRRIFLPADEAYGYYDPELVIEVPRRELDNGKDFEIGDEVRGRWKDGKVRTYRIVEATQKLLRLDGNHPLAGQDLYFEIETTAARDATNEELADSRSVNRILH